MFSQTLIQKQYLLTEFHEIYRLRIIHVVVILNAMNANGIAECTSENVRVVATDFRQMIIRIELT